MFRSGIQIWRTASRGYFHVFVEMGFARSYLVSLLLYVSIVNEIRLPLVTCQVEESTTFIPKRAIVALLRLLEDSSNSPAYSRTASMIQDVKNRNDVANLRGLSEGNDDCTPSGVYLELFKDPILREYLNMIVRTQRLPDFPRRTMDDSEEGGSRESLSESQKRSIATLAKNDDLPITIYDRVVHNEDDEEKRGVVSSEQSGPNGPQVFHDYAQPNGQLNLEALSEAFPTEKRNVAALARDFALPPGRRNIATSSRDYELPNDKRNVDSVLRERIMQAMGKRSVASLARTSALPQNGKRNVAAIARDYGLPFGKRYIGSLARTVGFPLREQSKRSVATLAKNSNWPVFSKKGLSVPGSVILRTLYRHGRSLNDLNAKQDFVDLQRLNGLEAGQSNYYEGDSFGDDAFGASHVRNGSSGKTDSDEENPKSQIDFSDEYPLPVMQNANVFDYEELMEALNGQYPYVEKRFMETGTAAEIQSEVGHFNYPETFRASKRHIGALARLGWLPSVRTARFSRSPRYLVGRENSADGSSTDDSSNSSTRSLRPHLNSRTRYVQALRGDCRHGFERSCSMFPRLI